MGEVRVNAEVVGPGASGLLKVRLERAGWPDGITIDVRADLLPIELRMPNATFVAVVRGRDVVRVEADGAVWLRIQELTRGVFNSAWDPVGVGDYAPDEYDNYIADVYSMVRAGASDAEIAKHLRWVETERMALDGSPEPKLLDVAAKLRRVLGTMK